MELPFKVPADIFLFLSFFLFPEASGAKQAPEQQVGSKRRPSIIQYGTSLCAPVYTCEQRARQRSQ